MLFDSALLDTFSVRGYNDPHMSKRDYVLQDPDEYSPLLVDDEEQENDFWENYQHFQQAVSLADRVDLDIVDRQTGRTTTFHQVRFSLRNLAVKN